MFGGWFKFPWAFLVSLVALKSSLVCGFEISIRIQSLSSLVVELFCGLSGGLGMTGVLEIKLFVIRLMWFSCAAFGWTLGQFDRKRRKKGRWGKEADSSEGWQVKWCVVPLVGVRWIVEFLDDNPLSQNVVGALLIVCALVFCSFWSCVSCCDTRFASSGVLSCNKWFLDSVVYVCLRFRSFLSLSSALGIV